MSPKRWNAVAVAVLLTASTSAFSGQEPAASEGALVLDGVIVAENPSNSIALVRRPAGGRARALRIGQAYAGHVLFEVTRDSAAFESATGLVRLFLDGAAPSPLASIEKGTGAESDESFEADEDSWVRRAFSRSSDGERLREEFPVILAETALAPRVEDGEVRGLKLTRLPGGTLLSEAGLRLGDVLMSINGEPLRDLDSLWVLLGRLRDENELRVVVERRGDVVRLAYAFEN